MCDSLTVNMEYLVGAMSGSVSEIIGSVNQLVKANGEISLALESLSRVTKQGGVQGNVVGFQLEGRVLQRDMRKIVESIRMLEATLATNIKQLIVTAELALKELGQERYNVALEAQFKREIHRSFAFDIERLIKLQASLARAGT